MNTNSIIEKLKKETALAEQKRKEEYEKEELKKQEEEEKELKEKMQKLFSSEITEENLVKFARNCESEYPLLFIKNEGHIIKNKKTGYKYNIGEAGKFLYEILEENGFKPEIVKIRDYDVKRLKKILPDIQEGLYLGIKW